MNVRTAPPPPAPRPVRLARAPARRRAAARRRGAGRRRPRRGDPQVPEVAAPRGGAEGLDRSQQRQRVGRDAPRAAAEDRRDDPGLVLRSGGGRQVRAGHPDRGDADGGGRFGPDGLPREEVDVPGRRARVLRRRLHDRDAGVGSADAAQPLRQRRGRELEGRGRHRQLQREGLLPRRRGRAAPGELFRVHRGHGKRRRRRDRQRQRPRDSDRRDRGARRSEPVRPDVGREGRKAVRGREQQRRRGARRRRRGSEPHDVVWKGRCARRGRGPLGPEQQRRRHGDRRGRTRGARDELRRHRVFRDAQGGRGRCEQLPGERPQRGRGRQRAQLVRGRGARRRGRAGRSRELERQDPPARRQGRARG